MTAGAVSQHIKTVEDWSPHPCKTGRALVIAPPHWARRHRETETVMRGLRDPLEV